MTLNDLAAHAAALLVYPGVLAAAATGLALEVAAGRTVPAGRRRRGGWWLPATLRRPLATRSVVVVVAGLLSVLAATQAGLPFSPISPSESSVLVAALAISAATWTAWNWSTEGDPASMLLTQLAWLVALVTPAIVPQDLRPQALGAVVLTGLLPLKACSALLYLLCLPGLLQLLPAAPAPGRGAGKDAAAKAAANGAAKGAAKSAAKSAGGGAARSWQGLLWLPLCGLFASAYFPPPGPGAGGTARFFLVALAAAALSLAFAAALAQAGPRVASAIYRRGIGTMATLTLVVAVATSALMRTA